MNPWLIQNVGGIAQGSRIAFGGTLPNNIQIDKNLSEKGMIEPPPARREFICSFDAWGRGLTLLFVGGGAPPQVFRLASSASSTPMHAWDCPLDGVSPLVSRSPPPHPPPLGHESIARGRRGGPPGVTEMGVGQN